MDAHTLSASYRVCNFKAEKRLQAQRARRHITPVQSTILGDGMCNKRKFEIWNLPIDYARIGRKSVHYVCKHHQTFYLPLTFFTSRCIIGPIPDPPCTYSRPFANSNVRSNRLPRNKPPKTRRKPCYIIVMRSASSSLLADNIVVILHTRACCIDCE